VSKKLLDTNILVDALRGLPACEHYLESLSEGDIFCSVITAAELWAGVRPDEEEDLDLFLAAFRWVDLDERTARKAGQYMQTFSRSHGLLLPDALIAASAHAKGADLLTLNLKHFPMKDIHAIAPY
jgi:predicted nucleic acid-binding protein